MSNELEVKGEKRMQWMRATRATVPVVLAISTTLMVVLPAIVPGCGPGSLDVDKAALYTPESLASELAFRYRSLHADAKKSTRPAKSDKAAAERLERATKVEKKGGAVKKKATTGPTTIDDVLDDIDRKLDLIKETSRPEACRKMAETISQDGSLTESDKKALAEFVGKLADGR
jgi:hypothetical protein